MEFNNVVMAFCQGPADNAHGFTNYRLVVPDVKRLTDARRVAIARAVIEFAGRKLADTATDAQLIQWSKTHMGRYPSAKIVDNGDGTVSYDTERSSGGNIPKDEIRVWWLQ